MSNKDKLGALGEILIDMFSDELGAFENMARAQLKGIVSNMSEAKAGEAINKIRKLLE